MRKKIIILFVIIMLACLVIIPHNEELRVRIIPFDNSDESLRVKEKVKELTVEFLEKNYDSNYNKYISNIENDIEMFNNSISSYDATSELCMHTFYDKSYNGNSIKNETVLTFLVKIGKAEGDNWWGVIYPKFLDIESTEKVLYKSYIIEKIKEWFGDF